MKESKREVDEEFFIKLSEKFNENKKTFWKKVKKERGVQNVNMKNKRMEFMLMIKGI